jgi:hypothetical protein
MIKQKQIQHQKEAELNLNELELIEDSSRFLLICLDSETIYLRSDLEHLLVKVEGMVRREEIL